MSNLHKSKWYDLILTTPLDILTKYSPLIPLSLRNIFPICIQENFSWTNTSEKDTFFLDLNIKYIGSDFHTSVYVKRDYFGFPIVNLPWLSGNVPRLLSFGICISHFVRFAICCTCVWISILNIIISLQNFWHRATDITSFEKHLENSSDHTLSFYPFGEISFQEYASGRDSYPVFYDDIVYKLRRAKGAVNFASSSWKIVKRLRRRKYEPMIIERIIGLVLGPSTVLYTCTYLS